MGKAPAKKPVIAKKEKTKVAHAHLFEKKPKNLRIGGDIKPKVDLSRYVKWPKCVQFQRMKKILLMRLKVPPAINQFNCAAEKNMAGQVLKLAAKYKPESKPEKRARLKDLAEQKVAGKEVTTKKPHFIKCGVDHVTRLVENKTAKLVVIAHDVDPIELVCWLPTLCRKKDVPYMIVKGKARLGQLVHQKKTACFAFTSVRKDDTTELQALCTAAKAQFNDNVDLRRKWGGGIMGRKSQAKIAARQKLIREEAQKRAKLA
jgi:large subunit ribosomal protein L7Ae